MLIAHARAAFGEVGYARASMDVIARRAGLRKSSLFHHFATKDELYLAVFADILGELGGFIDVARVGEGSFAERLETLSMSVTRYLGTHAEVAAIVLREFVDRGPFAEGAGKQIVDGVLETVTAFLDEGLKSTAAHAPERPALHPKHLALSITGLHLTYFAAAETSARLLGRSPFAPEEIEARGRAISAQLRSLCAC
jgi:TetR/AcrR family transcriptional regulator